MWLLIIAALVIVLVLLGLSPPATPKDEASHRVTVELHAIRRRFDVAQVKSEIRRDAADARRELRGELDARDRQRPRHG